RGGGGAAEPIQGPRLEDQGDVACGATGFGAAENPRTAEDGLSGSPGLMVPGSCSQGDRRIRAQPPRIETWPLPPGSSPHARRGASARRRRSCRPTVAARQLGNLAKDLSRWISVDASGRVTHGHRLVEGWRALAAQHGRTAAHVSHSEGDLAPPRGDPPHHTWNRGRSEWASPRVARLQTSDLGSSRHAQARQHRVCDGRGEVVAFPASCRSAEKPRAGSPAASPAVDGSGTNGSRDHRLPRSGTQRLLETIDPPTTLPT